MMYATQMIQTHFNRLVFATFAGCVGIGLLLQVVAVNAQEPRQLIVFAAASLTDAFEAIAIAFEAEYPDSEILFNFGGSSTLSIQLNQGAPADVFASADNNQMQVVMDAGYIAGIPQTFAHNRLVLIVPQDNPAQIQSLDDLAQVGVKLILAAPHVPIRTYTDTLFNKLAQDPQYGETYLEAVLANLVSEEANVRQVAAKVAFGEADAGIVYLSDVTPDISEDVLALTIPDTVNTIASYPIAVTTSANAPQLAQTFIDFVLSPQGQAILETWGLSPVIEEHAHTCILLCRYAHLAGDDN